MVTVSSDALHEEDRRDHANMVAEREILQDREYGEEVTEEPDDDSHCCFLFW